MKKVYIIGTGMEGRKTLTSEADSAVNESQVLVGASRMTDMFSHRNKPCVSMYSPEKISEYIDSCEYDTIAVLMSGDCGFFSGTKKLLPLLDKHDVSVISGISSPVYLCSKLGESWNDVCFLSMHGTDANIVRKVCSNEKVIAILGKEDDAAHICTMLTEYGRGDVTVYIGEMLGYADERIISGKACELQNIHTDKLSVIMILNPDYERGKQIGIDDSEFIRGKAPMTKSEIRAIVISKLCISDSSICWDIGSGTGSVSVEMAIQASSGKVYAVEMKEEAAELSKQNHLKFGCDNIIQITGKAPDVLHDLPAPDCVFIGGSSGHIKQISDIALEKNPNAVIVITAVSLETLSYASDALGNCEISQAAITRTEKIGSHTMLRAENPVFIIRRA